MSQAANEAKLRRLLRPRTVAVVGASRNPSKVGGAIFQNLLSGGFQGPVFPINPRATSVAGVLAWPTVRDVPSPVDLAVIATPRHLVAQVVDDCAAASVTGLVIVTAGYGEAQAEGKRMERALREQIRGHGMRVVGPNCLGVINTAPEIGLNATFAAATPPRGRVAMASQSGALGVALLDQARGIGLGVSQFVSLGNRIDISSNDLLELWERDDDTQTILLYLESVGDPQRFKTIARRISRSKAVIAVKGGRSAAGARAASSHTGSLAGATAAAEALFRQAGVLQVDTIEEMLGVAQVLDDQPLPSGDRVAIVTNAGGPGILAADACAAYGLQVAALGQDTRDTLRSFLPAEASVNNPVDMIASADPETFGRAVASVLADPGVDAVIPIYIEPLVTRPEPVAAALRAAVGRHGGDKPVVACFMMARGAPEGLQLGEGRQIPSFVFPEDAVRTLARVREYARLRERPDGALPQFTDVNPAAARARMLADVGDAEDARWLMPETAAALLEDFGIAVTPTRVALSVDEAIHHAQDLGYPVALKLRSATIVHKTDVGGVHLGLADAAAVRKAWASMAAGVAATGRMDEMAGAVIQPMVDLSSGHEVIVGMTDDPAFGPLLMAGLGGIHVELLKDVAFALHPLHDVDPPRMLRRLKGLPLLQGWRGAPAADLPALEDLLLRFSCLVGELPELAQIEINPVLLRASGEGCLALDMRAHIEAPTERRTGPQR
jgi:acetyl coenzyme A synthetase (ADP forming)-like protein